MITDARPSLCRGRRVYWRALGFGILIGLAAVGGGTVWYWLFSALSCRPPA